MKITHQRWEETGRELFGDDMTAWVFVCPICGAEMSPVKVRAEHAEHLPKLREGGYRIESECIGRYVPELGCDWAAYGLFSGPVFVEREGMNPTPVFDFAGRPFTSRPEPRS